MRRFGDDALPGRVRLGGAAQGAPRGAAWGAARGAVLACALAMGAALTASCVAAGSGTGRVGIRHAAGGAAPFERVEIGLDGRPAGVIGPGCSILLTTEAGAHELSAAWAGGGTTRAITVERDAVQGYELAPSGALVFLGSGATADAVCGPE